MKSRPPQVRNDLGAPGAGESSPLGRREAESDLFLELGQRATERFEIMLDERWHDAKQYRTAETIRHSLRNGG